MNERYVLSARVIHWLMALGFLVMWCSGYSIAELVEEDSALEKFLFSAHFTAGVTLVALLVLRIVIRLRNAPPPPPAEIPEMERLGAHFGHLALYVLPAFVLVLGWASVNTGGHTVGWFGVPMPKVFPTLEGPASEFLEGLIEDLHAWLAYTTLGLAVIHIAAALKHRWLDGHDVLHRITIGGRP